ncbi:predicted protein [Enterococcus gallinarum EG2]|nr:predicted protein [Enterococcus gallinarum EG2]
MAACSDPKSWTKSQLFGHTSFLPLLFIMVIACCPLLRKERHFRHCISQLPMGSADLRFRLRILLRRSVALLG